MGRWSTRRLNGRVLQAAPHWAGAPEKTFEPQSPRTVLRMHLEKLWAQAVLTEVYIANVSYAIWQKEDLY